MTNPNFLCLLLACAACRSDTPRATPTPTRPAVVTARAPVLDHRLPLRVQALGSPVRSARNWTTALVPNARGGWNFITQTLEAGSADPPEWIVVDLQAGTYKVTDASPRFANSNFTIQNQLRAPNGRVFFPLSDAGLAYYDPKDETVKELPPVVSNGDSILYSAKFASDGMLYAGTQSKSLPSIVQINPVTLAVRTLGTVGRDRQSFSYAYKLSIDPPWVYVVVGQMPWELAALNIKTRKSSILATRSDHPWMDLHEGGPAVKAQLITGGRTPRQVSDYVWCVDGKTIPVVPDAKLPFKARKLAPPSSPTPEAPEVDVTRLNPDPQGIGRVRWRPHGSKDWTVTEYKVKYTSAINIESLTALPGGGVLGSTQQYHGFFKTAGASSTFLGGPSPSQSKLAVLDGTVYMTGYPNGVLYAYDPKQPWTGTTTEKASEPGANPRLVGNFTEAAAKYALFLTPSHNRLYFAGRLERDGIGAGVGYYEPATKRFGGHHDNLLENWPVGLAVVPELKRIVLSSRVRPDAKAELIVYDSELVEIERLVVKPDLLDTGWIAASPVTGVIVGILPNAMYRYDLVAKKLLEWRDLPGKVAAIAARPVDGSLWVVMDRSLARVDAATLDITMFGQPGTLPVGIEHLVWQGDDVYASAGADLYRIPRVGLP